MKVQVTIQELIGILSNLPPDKQQATVNLLTEKDLPENCQETFSDKPISMIVFG